MHAHTDAILHQMHTLYPRVLVATLVLVTYFAVFYTASFAAGGGAAMEAACKAKHEANKMKTCTPYLKSPPTIPIGQRCMAEFGAYIPGQWLGQYSVPVDDSPDSVDNPVCMPPRPPCSIKCQQKGTSKTPPRSMTGGVTGKSPCAEDVVYCREDQDGKSDIDQKIQEMPKLEPPKKEPKKDDKKEDTPQTPQIQDFEKKPECSDFASSGGTKPVTPRTIVYLSWKRTGGTPETATITPTTGASTIESPVSITAPNRSTTYTLTLTNKMGKATCTTRVFVGPAGSDILSEEDEAYLAALKKAETPVETTETTTTESSSLSDPLCKQTGYGDLYDICMERARLRAEQEAAAREAEAGAGADGEPSTAGLVYGANPGPLISRYGQVEDGFIDDNAFQADPYAFMTDDEAFGSDGVLGEGGLGYMGSGDLDSLEKQFRSLSSKKTLVPNIRVGDGTGYTLWGQPQPKVTGSLGELREEDARPDIEEVRTSLMGRFGSWLKQLFCFGQCS